MSFDINEEPQQQQQENKYIHKVFKSGVQVRYPAKTGGTTVFVMPAFADKNSVSEHDWPTSWVPYRRPDDPKRFTEWAVRFDSWTLVAGRLNLYDPSTVDPSALNPMKALYDIAVSAPEFFHLTGRGPDGKKIQSDVPPVIPASSTSFAINAVELNPRKEDDVNVSRVITVKRTAFRPAYAGKNTGGSNNNWGLLSALDVKNRGIENVDPTDFSRIYYWGDITNPGSLVPCTISKMRPPSGGMPIFNMVPQESEGVTHRATINMLSSRVQLSTIFAENEPSEIIEVLTDLFSEYPSLVRRAFERSYPGVDNLIKKSGIVSDSRVHQAGYSPEPSNAYAQQPAQVAQPQQYSRQVPDAVQAPVSHLPVAAKPYVQQPVVQNDSVFIPQSNAVPQAFQPSPQTPAATVAQPAIPAQQLPVEVQPGQAPVKQTADDIRRSLMGEG